MSGAWRVPLNSSLSSFAHVWECLGFLPPATHPPWLQYEWLRIGVQRKQVSFWISLLWRPWASTGVSKRELNPWRRSIREEYRATTLRTFNTVRICFEEPFNLLHDSLVLLVGMVLRWQKTVWLVQVLILFQRPQQTKQVDPNPDSCEINKWTTMNKMTIGEEQQWILLLYFSHWHND